ncbi:MAG: NAD(P)/FAD-dependent oxidoreductase [Deltaproteobacteria bacterium]|nr:NAD(P)/FAD-dependent oxidoreductase [Deltaproteobacteria bacterium]
MSGAKVIVIGGGLNGLAAAGLLAKAGREVHVYEARDALGGLAAGVPFADGYTAPGLLHDTAMVRPWVADALGLAQHGLQREASPAAVTIPTERGAITLRGAEVSGDVGPGDADGVRRYTALVDAVRPVLARIMDQAPLDPRASLLSLLKTGLAVRRLGAATMLELMQVAPMCVADWTRSLGLSEPLAAALSLPAVEGSFTGPWSAHTATTALVRAALSGPAVVGGAPALVKAVVAAAKAHGAHLHTGARVTRILSDGARVSGVELASGEKVTADAVLSTLDPRSTFLCLSGPTDLPLGLVEDAKRYRMRGTTVKVHLALTGPLEDAAGNRITALRATPSLDDVERAFDAAKYRAAAEAPALDVVVREDMATAPGHAVASIVAHAASYDLAGGWTDDARQRFGRAALDVLSRHCPTVRDRVAHMEVLAPPDIAERYGVTGGHVLHGEHAPDQLLFLRPSVHCGAHRTPIAGLYVGGGATHPGGGLTLGPGGLAARAILSK